MHGVAALVAVAAVAYLLARPSRLSPIPLLLLGGVALGVSVSPSAELMESALILGACFLLFIVGMDLDPRRIRAQRRAALQVGVVQFGALALLGGGVALGIGLSLTEAAYVALALPASSTLVGVRLLQRRRQMFEPFGRLTLGVLLVQDALILLAIPVVTELDGGWRTVLAGLAGVGVLTALALAIRRWLVHVLPRIADETEIVLLGALAVLFVFLGAASALELPIVVGAFLAGVSLSHFPANAIARSEFAPIGTFFGAVFFTSLGALIRVPTPTELWQGAALALVVLVVTPPLVAVVAERAGFSSRTALESGLLLSQTSEISLVVVLSGMTQGRVSESLFVVVALVTLATMLVTPFISTDDVARHLTHLRSRVARSWFGKKEPPIGGWGMPDGRPSGHVLLLGAGSTGMPLLEDLLISGCSVVVIDDDPAVVRRVREAGIPAVQGEATDPRVLHRAGADRARVVSSTIRRPRDNGPLLELARDVPVLVRVFEQPDAEWVRQHGGQPILYSHAAADGLLEWFAASRVEGGGIGTAS